MRTPDLEPAPDLTHPEEMIGRVHFVVGSVLLRATGRATPAGLVAVSVLLLSTAALVWAVRRSVD